MKTIARKTIAQANELTSARHRLSPLQQKIYAMLVSRIKQDDDEFQDYVMSISDFMEDANLENKAYYEELKKAVEELVGKVLKIRLPDKGILYLAMLAKAHIKPKEGLIELGFHPDLKPYLLQLKERFTLLNVPNFFQLKSRHGIRIYQFFCQFGKSGWWETSVEDLKWRLELEDRYKDYTRFKQQVIESAQRDLKAVGIDFTFQEIKEKKKVVAIRFSFPHLEHGKPIETKTNWQTQSLVNPIEILQDDLPYPTIKRLLDVGLSESQVVRVIKLKEGQKITDLVNKTLYKLQINKPLNPTAYLWTVLQEHFPELAQKRKPSQKALRELEILIQSNDVERFWQAVLESIYTMVSPAEFDLWFQPIEPLQWSNGLLKIKVPNEETYHTLENEFLEVLRKSIRGIGGPKTNLEYVVVK